jgi:hypothetical protein
VTRNDVTTQLPGGVVGFDEELSRDVFGRGGQLRKRRCAEAQVAMVMVWLEPLLQSGLHVNQVDDHAGDGIDCPGKYEMRLLVLATAPPTISATAIDTLVLGIRHSP